MNLSTSDPRKYALAYAVAGLVVALIAGFSSARLGGLDIETAIYTVLAAALPAFLIRINEGFADARKPETITHDEALRMLGEVLDKRAQMTPGDREQVLGAVADNLAGGIDFDEDYHFIPDGSGRHLGKSVGCPKCAAMTIGQRG